jgi:xylulokinase
VRAVLGVDVGTSSLKAGLFALEGKALGATASVSYGLSKPTPRAMEQDPDDWWRALAQTARQLISEVEGGVDVVAVAIGGQAPTLCAVDADLRPTYPAVTWLDQRAAAVAERMYAGLGQPVPVWGSWPAQVAWLAQERPDAFGRTRWLLGCPDYLAARLTGDPAAFLAWPETEIAAAGVDTSLMPPLCAPGQVVGRVTAEAAAFSGLPVGASVVAGYVDGIMGVLGSGVGRQGDACMNSGTSGTFSIVGPPGVGYPVHGMCVLGGAANTSGKALDWFAERLAPGATYAELLDTAAGVPAGAGGLLFLPHLAGERAPVPDARARGAWVGLTLEHERGHLLRAILEGVAFGFRAVQDSLIALSGPVGNVYCVGGQARSDLWNQIKADVLRRPVLVPEVVEATVVGGAILAALGLGVYSSREAAVGAMVRVTRRFEPDSARADLYDQLYAAYSQLYSALRETNWRLHDLPTASTARVVAL